MVYGRVLVTRSRGFKKIALKYDMVSACTHTLHTNIHMTPHTQSLTLLALVLWSCGPRIAAVKKAFHLGVLGVVLVLLIACMGTACGQGGPSAGKHVNWSAVCVCVLQGRAVHRTSM